MNKSAKSYHNIKAGTSTGTKGTGPTKLAIMRVLGMYLPHLHQFRQIRMHGATQFYFFTINIENGV